MTNNYFEQAATPAPYRGGFEICPNCVTVVPTAYKAKHQPECAARHEAANAIEDGAAGITVDDATGWAAGDTTA